MNRYIYVGTYTQSASGHNPEGVFQFRINAADGSLTPVGATGGLRNPSFLAMHPTRQYLYAVNELGEGAVSAFSVEPGRGVLTALNSQPTRGSAPCYVSCDPSGKWLLTANYSSGNIAIYPINQDGSLEPMSGFVQHEGKLGPNQGRQERAHAHSIQVDPSGRFVLAADLGLDQVLVYSIDRDSGKLIANEPPGASFHPGAGPRHFDFSADGQFVYVANELDSSVTACSWDSQNGVIVPFQTLSTLPTGFEGSTSVADIHLAPGGDRLYVSNRGHDSLAKFEIDPKTGALTADGHFSTAGKTPRNFAIDPTGAYIYAANQDSSNLVVFKVDPGDGSLEPTGDEYSVHKPVCVLFVDL